MSDENELRVCAYSDVDNKLYAYKFSEAELQETAETFHRDIFFMVSESEMAVLLDEEPVDNLKEDYVWFQPGINKRSIIQCTCEKFLESDDTGEAGFARLAKKAVAHARRTGHALNLRGN